MQYCRRRLGLDQPTVHPAECLLGAQDDSTPAMVIPTSAVHRDQTMIIALAELERVRGTSHRLLQRHASIETPGNATIYLVRLIRTFPHHLA
jgi:hypothetical protein